jgi:hypothetical protein
MSRLIVLGATGSLGRHVVGQALNAGHQVTALVRTPSKLPAEARLRLSVHTGDLSVLDPRDIAELIRGHDALINCAGHVADGQRFVDLVDRQISSVQLLAPSTRPVCWFLAGAALLDIDSSGRRGVDLPKVSSTYWPHRVNLENLSRSDLDWRLLCPGPMVEQPALGLAKLRCSLDRLPVDVPKFARVLPGPLFLPVFASLIPEMIVPYADAAALMLAHLARDDAFARHRVGLALPPGMRGEKPHSSVKRQPADPDQG